MSVSEETSISVSEGSHSINHKSNHRWHWLNTRCVSGSPSQASQPLWSLLSYTAGGWLSTYSEGSVWRVSRTLPSVRPGASFSESLSTCTAALATSVISEDPSRGTEGLSRTQPSRREWTLGRYLTQVLSTESPSPLPPDILYISCLVLLAFWNDLIPLCIFEGCAASVHTRTLISSSTQQPHMSRTVLDPEQCSMNVCVEWK